MDRLGVLEADYFDLEYVNRDGNIVGFIIFNAHFSHLVLVRPSQTSVQTAQRWKGIRLHLLRKVLRTPSKSTWRWIYQVLIFLFLLPKGTFLHFKLNGISTVVKFSAVKTRPLFWLLSLFRVSCPSRLITSIMWHVNSTLYALLGNI